VFSIFSLLHQNGKQVILTSDKAPVDMQDERLLSRFKWGLSAEVHQPDYDTRISILKKIYCIEMVSKFRGNYRICRSQY
jgi:chromosomal replication initiator protein